MSKLFVCRDIPDQGLKMLKKRKSLQIDIYEKDRIIPRRDLLRRVKGADIILSILTDKMDAEVMQAAGPQLKMIANYAVGFDNIDLAEAKKRNITVTNTPGEEISDAVAEHAIALIFALAHRVTEANTFARAGKYRGWGPKMLLGQDVGGKTLGIIGGGRIGGALARQMKDGFGIKIIYNDIQRNKEFETACGARYVSKIELLKKSDIVSLHVPLLPSTRHLISTKEFALMKKTAFLINTARGPVVDERALIHALRTGEIAGAGIDVFEHEPSIPRALRKLPNVVLTPHTASATWGARQAMSRTAATNILAFLDGKTPPQSIN